MISLLLNAPDLGDHDQSAWRLLIYGASPMPDELMHRAARTLGVGFLQLMP